LFFAVVRFSPPSQETEAAKRKAKAKNKSPDLQEPILIVWLRLSEAKPRQGIILTNPHCWFITASENKRIS